MPQLGETVTEGTITKWHKQVGDTVAEDEVLFEVSTDKVDSEVPSPVSGTVTEILVPEGETVSVGSKLAVIGAPGDAPSPNGATTAEASADLAPTAKGGEPETNEAVSPEQARAMASEERLASEASEEKGTAAEAKTEPLGAAAGTAGLPEPAAGAAGAVGGRRGQGLASSQAPTPGAAKPPLGGPARPGARPADQRPPSAPSQAGPSRLLSPVVRRLIAEHGLDPAQIVGSGAGGRVTRDDVLAAISRQGPDGNGAGALPAGATGLAGSADLAELPAGAQAPKVTSSTPTPQAGERDTVLPFTNIRRRTAEHMVRSKQTSAHTMVAVEVDYSVVEKARLPERERFKAANGFSLTYLPFIARAVVDALAEWPHLNSSVGEDELIVHGDVNLGIAVDLDFEGLLVPVVHRAEEKRLVALAREMADLASRARSKRLTMDDISGGTFTLTNAGGFGTFLTVPVINQPQVAILSTDGVRKRPVAVEMPDGPDGIVVHPVGNLVMSWDHRAVDGAYAAAFLAKVRDLLQTRDWSAEF